MALGKRVYTAVSVALGVGLAGIVLEDIYADWILEDKPFWSTLIENLAPLLLAVAVAVAGIWMYQYKRPIYSKTVARWQLIGTAGILLLVGWVIGLQQVQGELKPAVIIVQTTVGGAIAGTLIGYTNARLTDTLANVRQQRNKFQALFENAPAEIIEVEQTATGLQIHDANDAFEDVFGVCEPNQSLSDHLDYDEELFERIRSAIESEELLETEVSVQTQTGQGYFQLRVAPYGRSRAYIIYLDVTEMKDIQRDLEQTVTQLERSNDRLEDFAYIASHDLQEPLRTVSRYADLIREEHTGELSDQALDYLDTVVTGAERMSSMVNGLLDYSRVTTRGGEFQTIDSETMIEEVVRDLDVLRRENDGTITYESLPTVTADRDQLWQVFQNLIKNALEHSGDEPVEVTISGEEIEHGYRFVVEDDGPGIDPYMQDDIFQMFESGQNYQTQGDAKGIGLAVVQRIIDRHDGDIWVESDPGKGSRFYFTISKL